MPQRNGRHTKYRIETKKAFYILGVSTPPEKELGENLTILPHMWRRCAENGTFEKLSQLACGGPAGLFGVSACNGPEHWRYFIAIASAWTNPAFEEYYIPETTWAVFSEKGTNRSVQKLERHIFTECLPASGYEYGNASDEEDYPTTDPCSITYEIWVPVEKRALARPPGISLSLECATNPSKRV